MAESIQNRCPDCFSDGYQGGICPFCGYQPKEEEVAGRVLTPGTLLHQRYLLGRVLGEGGFGITYKVLDLQNNEIRAMKEYAPVKLCARSADQMRLVPLNGEEEHFEYGMERFMKEASILSRLKGVPAVVNIMDRFEENATAYFIMEFLHGSDLRQIIRVSKGRVPIAYATRIVAAIAEVMDVVHTGTRIIHRDITPENIYITSGGQVKLLDFGSAKQYLDAREESKSIELKLKFAPPEQFSDRVRQGPYTDVYSLAATYYYALTGMRLPSAPDRKNGKAYVKLTEAVPELPASVSDAVDRALDLDHTTRTQTMREFKQGILPAIEPVRQETSQDQERQSREYRSWQIRQQQEIQKQHEAEKQRQALAFRQAEAIRQAEFLRQQEELKRQIEFARREEEARRQVEQARREAEARRQSELARREAEARRQAEIARREAEARRQAEIARQQAELVKRQAEQARQQAELARRQAEARQQQAEAKRQAEAKHQAEARRQAELARKKEQEKRLIPYIKLLSGPSSGKWWPVPAGQRLTVGRSDSKANIRIDAPADVSRVHMQICYLQDKQVFQVTDLSENGTYSGGRSLRKNVCYELKIPVRLTLAGQRCIVEMGISYESN